MDKLHKLKEGQGIEVTREINHTETFNPEHFARILAKPAPQPTIGGSPLRREASASPDIIMAAPASPKQPTSPPVFFPDQEPLEQRQPIHSFVPTAINSNSNLGHAEDAISRLLNYRNTFNPIPIQIAPPMPQPKPLPWYMHLLGLGVCGALIYAGFYFATLDFSKDKKKSKGKNTIKGSEAKILRDEDYDE